MEESKFYTTKVTVEVEVMHQFDPVDVYRMIERQFQFPAVKSFRVLKLETNYRVFEDPSDNFVEVDFKNCI